MKQSKIIISSVLVLSLFLFCFCNPLVASANTTTQTFVEIGMNYQDIVQVAPYLVPIILLLVACEWYYSNTDAIVAKAEEIWNNTSTAFHEWVMSHGPIVGSSALKIHNSVRTEFNEQMSNEEDPKKLPEDKPYLLVPPSLLSLNTLTQNDVLSADISGALAEGNQLQKEGNGILSNIRSGIASLSLAIQECFQTISSTFKAEFDQFKTWYKNINDNLKEEIHQIPNWLSNINTNMKNELGQVKTWLSNINTNLKNELLGVKTTLVQIKDNAIAGVTTAIDNVGIKIDNAVEAIKQAIAGGNGNGGGDDDENIKGVVGDSAGKFMPFFGTGKDYISEYSAGFLVAGMIFNKFADIPVLNKLIFVSATIGVLGALLGIALNASQSEKNRTPKEKTRSNAKGG